MCGIGNPDRFFSDLQDFGITIEKKNIRPDHDRKFELMLKKRTLTWQTYCHYRKRLLPSNSRNKKNPACFCRQTKTFCIT